MTVATTDPLDIQVDKFFRIDWDSILDTLLGRLQFPKTVTILFVQGLIYKMEWFYSS